jgi:hypothetical protein
MSKISGAAEAFNSRKVNIKGKERTSWGVLIGETWYNTLMNPDNFDIITNATKGQVFSFDAEKRGNFWNISGSISVDGEEAPAKTPYKRASKFKKADKDVDWDAKDRRIVYQSSLKIAGHLVTTALEQNALPALPAKKAEKWDELMNLVFSTADRISAEVYARSDKPFSLEMTVKAEVEGEEDEGEDIPF